MEKGTRLSGKLIDATGRSGIVEMTVDEKDSSLVRWKITLREREHNQTVIEGLCRASEEGDKLLLKPAEEKQNGNSKVTWEARLRRAPAGRYAEYAYFGEYQGLSEQKNELMTSGITVIWKFK